MKTKKLAVTGLLMVAPFILAACGSGNARQQAATTTKSTVVATQPKTSAGGSKSSAGSPTTSAGAGRAPQTTSSTKAPDPSTPSSSSAQSNGRSVDLAPKALDGRTVSIAKDVPLVVAIGASTDSATWTGTVTDSSIAEFVAGKGKSAPSFTGKKVGTTKATLTGPDGKKVSFTLTVVADSKDVSASTR